MAPICGNPDIWGIATDDHEYNVLPLQTKYISQTHRTSLPSLMSQLARFNKWSNYKINLSKSEAFSVSLHQTYYNHSKI